MKKLVLLFVFLLLIGCSSKYSKNSKEDIEKLKIEAAQGLSESDIKQSWTKGLEEFKQIRKNYLIYD